MNNRIEQEPEDLFASREEHEDSSHNEEEVDEVSELSAAAALTSLVCSSPPVSKAIDEEKDEEEPAEEANDDEDFEIPERFTKSGRKRAVSFPLKLMKILSTKKNEEIIAWTPSGKAFEIRKPKQFVSDILPVFMKQAKFSSFTRKLHRWGFQRHYRGDEAGAFFHQDFIKGRLDLVEQMTCAKNETVVSKPAPRKQPAAPKPRPVVAEEAPLSARPSAPVVRTPVVMGPAMAPPPRASVDSRSVDLNAAIEMEVTRRLKERINQAALNRQALALLEQQQQQQHKIERFLALAQAQQAGLRNLAMSQHPQMGLASLYSKFKPSLPVNQYAFGSDSQRGLPPTNIQGAKTA